MAASFCAVFEESAEESEGALAEWQAIMRASSPNMNNFFMRVFIAMKSKNNELFSFSLVILDLFTIFAVKSNMS